MNRQSNTSLDEGNDGQTLSEMPGEIIVVEREFKSRASHTDRITGITDLNDGEFMTCSLDNSFKVWDKELKACDYTIETHGTLHNMTITGEQGKSSFLIASLGEGDMIVYDLNGKRQRRIQEKAH